MGTVNIYNILAATAATHARGVERKQIAEGVKALSHVPGRFQRVDAGQPFTVNSIFDVNQDGNLTDRLDSTTGLQVTGNRAQPKAERRC